MGVLRFPFQGGARQQRKVRTVRGGEEKGEREQSGEYGKMGGGRRGEQEEQGG